MDAPAKPAADLYINRELSQLEFNKRVFAQALDATVPLLERLRFLCITCTNLDEFFEIRVAVLKQQIEIGAATQGPDKLTAQQVFDALRHNMLDLVQQQYQLLNEVLLPELAAAGVSFVESAAWSDEQRTWLHKYFLEQVVPVLTPLTFDPSRPFPKVLNKSLNFIVRLEGKDAFGRRRHRGMVQAPRSLPRVIRLPNHLSSPDCHDYVFLSSIIREHIDELFPGLEVGGCYPSHWVLLKSLGACAETQYSLVAIMGLSIIGCYHNHWQKIPCDHWRPSKSLGVTLWSLGGCSSHWVWANYSSHWVLP